ncbi:MAG: hypothetical protein S4CHLAM6_04350 [Chlamydiae bacterium]|nr:hypothetical protein [Chlamydiota bacterium]
MSISAFKQVDQVRQKLIASNFKDLKSFEALGVHPKDFAAQARLANVITLIANQTIKPIYDPDSQMIHYCDSQGVPKAVFKPGLARASDETFMRRMVHKMDSSDSSIAAMIATFDFSSLDPISAKELNPDAFDSDIFHSDSEDSLYGSARGSDYLSSRSSSGLSEEYYSDFSPSSSEEEVLANIADLPFAMEEFRNGTKAQYLPTAADGSDKEYVGPSDELLMKGTLLGVLEPWIEEKTEDDASLAFVKTVLLAAVTGGRDIKLDAIVGSTLIDIEESMAAEAKGSQAQKPSIHLPVLEDAIAQKALTVAEIKELIKFAEGWDIEELVRYARSQKQAFNMNEIDKLQISDDPEDPSGLVVHSIAAAGLTLFIEESMREKEFFPSIPSGKSHLFVKRQIKALKARLERIKTALAKLGASDESQWPEVNLWGLINIVDPKYGEFCNLANGARKRALSGESTGLGPQMERALFIDSKRPALFVQALTQSAGRVEALSPLLTRTVSLPEMATLGSESEGEGDSVPVSRTLSADPDLLSDREFTFIPTSIGQS